MIESESASSPKEPLQWAATSPEGGSLTVIYDRDDEIANTLGHLGAIRTHVILGTVNQVLKEPTSHMAKDVFDLWRNEQWKNPVEVYVGASPSLNNHVEKLFTVMFDRIRKDLRKSGYDANLDPAIFREHSLANTLIKAALARPWLHFKLHRTDHFSAATQRVITYHPDKAVPMHELGHAWFYDQREDADKMRQLLLYLLPGFRAYQEWQASKEAMKRFPTREERIKAMKILEPAWWSYAGDDVRRVVTPLIPAVAPTIPYVAIIVGHILSRLPLRRHSFGQPLTPYASTDYAETT